MTPAQPSRHVLLSFEVGGAVPDTDERREFRASLSSLVILDGGRTLWIGGDETVRVEPSIERLSLEPDGSYAQHRSFSVSDFIDLPDDSRDAGRVGEIDIEGMDEDGGYLWFTGSHCSTRKRPNPGKSIEAQIKQLSTVRRGKNRFLVGRIPVAHDASGSRLERQHAGRRAARLERGWLKELRSDPHLGLFLSGFDGDRSQVVPGKDNGFDVEGLSATTRADGSTRLLLGLRGPVLRGFAVVLELCPDSADEGSLEPGTIPGGVRSYRKHFLELGGLGVRDLGFIGDDLWILAGPTLALDGPVALFRWRSPFRDHESGDTLTRLDGERLRRELLLPFGEGDDHAEAFAMLDGGSGSPVLMVLYDSPSPGRLVGSSAVRVDLFEL